MSTKDSDTTDTSKLYKITADYKNSTYATEQWTNALSNGKQVTILATLEYRSGDFEIELTDAEKESILKKESIVLNDYCVSVNELWSGWGPDIEIKNEDMYKAFNETKYVLTKLNGNNKKLSQLHRQYMKNMDLYEKKCFLVWNKLL